MNNAIVVTGASSGFGALTARALAHAGHTVYAGMRDSRGRNAAQVAEASRYASEHRVDLRTVELDVASDESTNQGIATIIGGRTRRRDRSQCRSHVVWSRRGLHARTVCRTL